MKSNFGKGAIALTVSTLVGFTALPAQSALLVSSSGDNSIKQYDEGTGAYIRDFVNSGSGGLLNPQGLTLGANGNLFVASFGDNSIKEYSGISGEYIRDFASSSSGLLAPQGLASANDGSLFAVSNRIPGTEIDRGSGVVERKSGVLQYNGTTGQLLNTFSTGSVGLPSGPQPFDVAVNEPNNSIFISQGQARFNPGGIREYDITTTASLGGFNTSGSFFSPRGLALGNDYLFYTDGTSVGRLNLETRNNDTAFFDSNGGLSNAVDVALGNNGNLLVSSSGTNSIKQYDGQTGNFLGDLVASGSGGLSNPTFVTTANVPVPEPSSVLGVLAFGGLFAGGALRRKRVAKLQK